MPLVTSSRGRRAALKKQDRGYAFGVAKVPDAEWVSQSEAARELGIGGFRVGVLIMSGQLDPVHNGRGQAGVSRSSVETQRIRRVGVGVLRRARIFMTDGLKALINGI